MNVTGTDNLKSDFEENGYVLVRGLLPQEVISSYLAGFIATISPEEDLKKLSKVDPSLLFDVLSEHLAILKDEKTKEHFIGLLKAYTLSVNSKNIVYNSRLVEFVCNLMGTNLVSQIGNPVLHVVCDQLSFDGRKLNAPWHQDWPALKTSQKTIVCWVPFGGAENGGELKMKRKSHSQGTFDSVGVSNVVEINEKEIEAFYTVSFAIRPTDCLIFD